MKYHISQAYGKFVKLLEFLKHYLVSLCFICFVCCVALQAKFASYWHIKLSKTRKI